MSLPRQVLPFQLDQSLAILAARARRLLVQHEDTGRTMHSGATWSCRGEKAVGLLPAGSAIFGHLFEKDIRSESWAQHQVQTQKRRLAPGLGGSLG